MNKVGIVILNYLNFKDTIECVESLEDDLYSNKEIIIVDNASENESWKILTKKYEGHKNIHLLQTEQNVGYARGNNEGIVFARGNLKCEHILIVNNDTVFEDKNMITKLVNSYEKGIGIIGPKIINADNKNQNPVKKFITVKSIDSDLDRAQGKSEGIIRIISGKIVRNLKKIIVGNDSEKLMLHGSCMLLTKDYFKYYPIIFPETFLYYEEDIISLLTQKVKLRKKYVKDVYIYHKEDKSSEMSFNNSKSIKNKYMIDSILLCKKLIKLDYSEIKKIYFNS